MVTSEFPPISGGIGPYVYNLSKKLLGRGHKIDVITRGSIGRTERVVVDGINVFKVPFLPLYPFHVVLLGTMINRLFKSMESRYTLIHSHTPMPLPIKTSLPTITTVHTPMKIDARYHEAFSFLSFAERAQSLTIYPPIETKLFRISDMITAVSSRVARELLEYGLDPTEITVAGNGVDETTFVPTQNRGRRGKYVLFTGVLGPRKGLFDLIECAHQVCRVHANVRFFIGGRGPFLGRLQRKVKRMGLQERIVFLGYVEKTKFIEVYQNATVHVVPSHYEGLPTVLLEAMSCGLPVVATDIGGNNEVISSGSNGFLVPAKSPQRMAEIILKLLDDDELREKIGIAARRTIEKRYTWDKIANKILVCYERIL